MRLAKLESGHTLRQKALFALLRTLSRQPLPDVVKVLTYRNEYFGAQMSPLFQAVMRGPSEWSIGERELMAAYVSRRNECEFCTRAHGAVASLVMGHATVEDALADPATAPLTEPLRAMLGFLREVTRESVTAESVAALLAAGVTKAQVRDALNVAFCFDVINRLADAFRFDVGTQASFDASAKMLLEHGYNL